MVVVVVVMAFWLFHIRASACTQRTHSAQIMYRAYSTHDGMSTAQLSNPTCTHALGFAPIIIPTQKPKPTPTPIYSKQFSFSIHPRVLPYTNGPRFPQALTRSHWHCICALCTSVQLPLSSSSSSAPNYTL